MFQRLMDLSRALTAKRLKRGSIDFDVAETKVELDAEGKPSRMVRRERLDAHRLIEECMLAANEAVARYFRTRGVLTLNRYHGAPDEEKLEAFVELAGAYGLQVKRGALTSLELNGLLRQLDGHPEKRALNQLLLRSMMQAIYTSKNEGHYGLGAQDYLHFTSPIRRYPDLIVHRLLKQMWANEPMDEEQLEEMAIQSSDRERAAMKVEREVVSFYACLMVKDRVGEEFDATVSGLTEQGFFAELDGLYIDGMVKVPGWMFEKRLYRGILQGAQVVKVGQKPFACSVASVNLGARKIDLELLSLEEDGEQVEAARAELPPGVRRGRDSQQDHQPPRRGKQTGGGATNFWKQREEEGGRSGGGEKRSFGGKRFGAGGGKSAGGGGGKRYGGGESSGGGGGKRFGGGEAPAAVAEATAAARAPAAVVANATAVVRARAAVAANATAVVLTFGGGGIGAPCGEGELRRFLKPPRRR